MTRELFEVEYAIRSGVTVAELHEWNMHAEPCDCHEDGCEGWQMVGPSNA